MNKLLTKCKQDSSASSDWVVERYEFDTGVESLWIDEIARIVSDSPMHPLALSYPIMVNERVTSDEYASTIIERDFRALMAEWKQATIYQSSSSKIAEHDAYQAIIGMGKDVIPLILKEMEETPDQWFWALRAITRESPVRSADRGDIRAMTDAWLDWGRQRRYI